MAHVPMDEEKVATCRGLAARVADDVQRYIDAHTSVGVERTTLRSFGADGVDDQGVPLVNAAIDRYHQAGLLDRGISYFLGRALLAGDVTVVPVKIEPGNDASADLALWKTMGFYGNSIPSLMVP